MSLNYSGFTIDRISKVVGFSLVAAIAAFVFMIYTTLAYVGIGGETYKHIVDGKDFVADFLPPPLYPVEAFAEAHIIEGDLQRYSELAPVIAARKDSYNKRLEFWRASFENSEVLSAADWKDINGQFTSLGERFWSEMDNHFLPAAQVKSELEAGASVDRLAGLISSYQALIAALNEKVAASLATTEADTVEAALGYKVKLMSIGIGMAMLVIVVVLLAQFKVSNALTALEAAMRKLAGGELTTEVPFISRNDEIGKMAQSLNVFKALAVQENQNKEGLQQVIESVGKGLAHLAKGNLSHRIVESFPEATERLRTSFNAAADELSSVIATVKNGAVGQDSASCVVYGMPRAAFDLGAVEKQLPLAKIGDAIAGLMSQ